jgi:hypothetical protein
VVEPGYPIRIESKALCGLLVTTLLAVGASGCGGGGKSTGVASHGLGARGASTKSVSNGGLRPRHAVGDYDTDDYEASSDADDDDSTGRLDRDGDTDNPSGSIYDSDDTNLASYSHSAGPAQTRVVASLVRRYLAAAAAADGAKACSMILESVASEIAPVLGGPGEPPYSRGRTCAEILSKIFRFYRRQLTMEARLLRVLRFGVNGDKGLATLAAKPGSVFPDRVIALQREDGTWKIDGVLDQEQP